MTHLWLNIVLAFATGMGLGLFFFGGLWLTVRRIPSSRHPKRLVWSSFLVRQILTIALLLLVCQTDWHRWSAALAGFLAMRTLMILQQHGKKRI